MADLIEEIKQKQRRRTIDAALATVVVLIGMAALIYFSAKSDKDRQRELYTYGGAVGVENQTSRRVTIHLYQHNNPVEPVLSHTIEPQGHWVIRDSMSQWQVSHFPPLNWLDSAYIIFDDTLLLRQAGNDPWYVERKNHYLRESTCWQYESLVVRSRSRYHPALYRPLRVYYLTNEDYKRAIDSSMHH